MHHCSVTMKLVLRLDLFFRSMTFPVALGRSNLRTIQSKNMRLQGIPNIPQRRSLRFLFLAKGVQNLGCHAHLKGERGSPLHTPLDLLVLLIMVVPVLVLVFQQLSKTRNAAACFSPV